MRYKVANISGVHSVVQRGQARRYDFPREGAKPKFRPPPLTFLLEFRPLRNRN